MKTLHIAVLLLLGQRASASLVDPTDQDESGIVEQVSGILEQAEAADVNENHKAWPVKMTDDEPGENDDVGTVNKHEHEAEEGVLGDTDKGDKDGDAMNNAKVDQAHNQFKDGLDVSDAAIESARHEEAEDEDNTAGDAINTAESEADESTDKRKDEEKADDSKSEGKSDDGGDEEGDKDEKYAAAAAKAYEQGQKEGVPDKQAREKAKQAVKQAGGDDESAQEALAKERLRKFGDEKNDPINVAADEVIDEKNGNLADKEADKEAEKGKGKGKGQKEPAPKKAA